VHYTTINQSLKQEETRRGGALIALPLFSLVINTRASAGNTDVETKKCHAIYFFLSLIKPSLEPDAAIQ
jgi:hypothetical protein